MPSTAESKSKSGVEQVKEALDRANNLLGVYVEASQAQAGIEADAFKKMDTARGAYDKVMDAQQERKQDAQDAVDKARQELEEEQARINNNLHIGLNLLGAQIGGVQVTL